MLSRHLPLPAASSLTLAVLLSGLPALAAAANRRTAPPTAAPSRDADCQPVPPR